MSVGDECGKVASFLQGPWFVAWLGSRRLPCRVWCQHRAAARAAGAQAGLAQPTHLLWGSWGHSLQSRGLVALDPLLGHELLRDPHCQHSGWPLSAQPPLSIPRGPTRPCLGYPTRYLNLDLGSWAECGPWWACPWRAAWPWGQPELRLRGSARPWVCPARPGIRGSCPTLRRGLANVPHLVSPSAAVVGQRSSGLEVSGSHAPWQQG